MKKLLFILFIALISLSSKAQFDLEWYKTLKNTQSLVPNQKGIETRVIEAGPNNDIYIAGWFNGTMDFDSSPANYFLTPVYNYSGFIAKYNSLGTLIWAKQLDELTGDGLIVINDLMLDSNDNVYITGKLSGPNGVIVDFDPSNNNYNDSTYNQKLFLAKYNFNGDFIWEKNTGSIVTAEGVELFIDNSNNIYVGAHSGTSIIIKFDSDGNLIWHKKFIGSDVGNYGAMHVSSNGEIYITGRGSNVDADLGTGTNILLGSSIIFLGKYNSDANLIWAKKINTSMTQTNITVDNDGNIFTAGHSQWISNDIRIITKWSGNGMLLSYLNTPPYMKIDNMAINCSNNLLISGFYNHASNNFDLLGGNFSIPSQGSNFGGYNYFIASYNTIDLSINWAKGLQGGYWPSPGIDNNHSTKYVDIKKSNNFYVASTFTGTSDVDPNATSTLINPVANNYNDLFFAKYSGCNSIGLPENENNTLPNLFPNPTNGIFTIANLKGNAIIQILDITGRIVFKTQTKNENITIHLNDVEKGMYVYKIIDKQGFVQSGKIVVQ
jgi:hypothetical protein